MHDPLKEGLKHDILESRQVTSESCNA